MNGSTVSRVDRVRAVIDQIVAEDRKCWRLSYLIRRAQVTQRDAEQAIDDAILAGVIAPYHTVVCPHNGDTLAGFADAGELPAEGKLIECHACNANDNEWHEIDNDMFEISYVTAGHVVRANEARIVD